MSPNEFEDFLSGANEGPDREFKGAMDWNRNTLIKDILAMANIDGGGRIVIGISDGEMTREGLTDDQLASFDHEEMRDAIAPFADPHVEFEVEAQQDINGLNFVIINVAPFSDGPVICARDGHDVRAGVIYYRGRRRRPESAPISSSSELREVIERAIVQRARALERMGFSVTADSTHDFEEELGGL